MRWKINKALFVFFGFIFSLSFVSAVSANFNLMANDGLREAVNIMSQRAFLQIALMIFVYWFYCSLLQSGLETAFKHKSNKLSYSLAGLLFVSTYLAPQSRNILLYNPEAILGATLAIIVVSFVYRRGWLHRQGSFDSGSSGSFFSRESSLEKQPGAVSRFFYNRHVKKALAEEAGHTKRLGEDYAQEHELIKKIDNLEDDELKNNLRLNRLREQLEQLIITFHEKHLALRGLREKAVSEGKGFSHEMEIERKEQEINLLKIQIANCEKEIEEILKKSAQDVNKEEVVDKQTENIEADDEKQVDAIEKTNVVAFEKTHDRAAQQRVRVLDDLKSYNDLLMESMKKEASLEEDEKKILRQMYNEIEESSRELAQISPHDTEQELTQEEKHLVEEYNLMKELCHRLDVINEKEAKILKYEEFYEKKEDQDEEEFSQVA